MTNTTVVKIDHPAGENQPDSVQIMFSDGFFVFLDTLLDDHSKPIGLDLVQLVNGGKVYIEYHGDPDELQLFLVADATLDDLREYLKIANGFISESIFAGHSPGAFVLKVMSLAHASELRYRHLTIITDSVDEESND